MDSPHRPSGCLCPQCWSLAEYMAHLTGKDYGLNPAPGHAPSLQAVKPSSSMTDLDPEEFKRLQEAAKRRPRNPWEIAA